MTKEEAKKAYTKWVQDGEVGLQHIKPEPLPSALRWWTERNFYKESFPLDNKKFLAVDPVSLADRDIQAHNTRKL